MSQKVYLESIERAEQEKRKYAVSVECIYATIGDDILKTFSARQSERDCITAFQLKLIHSGYKVEPRKPVGIVASKSAASEFIFNCGIQSYECIIDYIISGQAVKHTVNTLTYIAKITTTRDAAFKIHAHVGLICATILAEYKIAGIVALPFDNLLQRYKLICISRADGSESCATIILA
ncbi:MAG: hypothetical protein M0R33_15335 [Methylomonas sp.]|jgi:hypothetical protein|uniref:hypothetical protein n=1 Tax=Methylomonas sp. TaxID=418 RepID=UPI0025E5ECC5|nr:hypothetical protein [Methylomonas sp.]MCK9607815.1 hypothetical protein [Methylomonas sp.]